MTKLEEKDQFVPGFSDPIVIVGAGCFGSSTAYHLLKRGFKNVTLLDRSETIPGPDIASNDINRIVRTSYSDKVYSELGKEAIEAWKTLADDFGGAYHESGVLCVGSKSLENSDNFVHQSYLNDLAMGSRVHLQDCGKDLYKVFPANCDIGSLAGTEGYMNLDNGWADAGLAIRNLHTVLRHLGCHMFPNKMVVQLLKEDGVTCGVKCQDGSEYPATSTILACGAWTASSFPKLQLDALYRATGQSVAMVQLTPDETTKYQNVPVVLSFDTGFYVFPPTNQGIMKMAIHNAGVLNLNKDAISTPRTSISDPQDGHLIPKEILEEIRKHFRMLYPSLGSKPILNTRLCWYNDTLDGDWIIGHVPGDNRLVMATGDSGHAFKFLPILGKLVSASILGELDRNLSSKFSPARMKAGCKTDPSRHGQEPSTLLPEQLCAPKDYV